jgi:glycosyltransferase involved in cell wall biosynthesis
VGINVCEELGDLGITKERITYIPNGVDTERFKPSNNKRMLRKKFGIPEEDLIILSIGRLSESKQPLKLIEVFSAIERKMETVTLLVAGKGELLETLKEYAMNKNIRNIRFIGFVPDTDLPDLYACSDYFIIASMYEGGEPVLTVAEAMASGLPCIVSDIPNLRFIEGAKSGIVVNFNDVEKVTEDATEYLEKDNSEHSKNAREYAVNNLDWKIIAEKYLELFYDVKNTEDKSFQ